MNKNERYRQVAEVKAELNRLFKKQEPAFCENFSFSDYPNFYISIYPTGGVCVKVEVTYALYGKTMYFYTHDLRLICRDDYTVTLSTIGEHERVLYNKDGDIIWCAYRWVRDFDLYLPKGACGFLKYSTSLNCNLRIHKAKAKSNPRCFEREFCLRERHKEWIKKSLEKYQASKKNKQKE